MSKRNEVLEPNSFVEIRENVSVQNQSQQSLQYYENNVNLGGNVGFLLKSFKTFKYTHEGSSLWLHNSTNSTIVVGYSPSIT